MWRLTNLDSNRQIHRTERKGYNKALTRYGERTENEARERHRSNRERRQTHCLIVRPSRTETGRKGGTTWNWYSGPCINYWKYI